MEAEYRTVAYLRAGNIYGEPHLDGFMCARWPKGFSNEGFRLACEIEELSPDDWLVKHGFHEAFELMRAFPSMQMQMRARANMMVGPFIFITDVPLDEDTTLRLVLLRHEEKQRERRRRRKEGA